MNGTKREELASAVALLANAWIEDTMKLDDHAVLGRCVW